MKRLFTIALFFCYAILSFTQVPLGFNYQAVLRNAEGQPLVNQNVSIRLTLQNEDGNTQYYSETHSLQTSPQGVVSMAVGSGSGSVGNLDEIPWVAGGIVLQVEVDPSGGEIFSILGTSPLLAVPYALHAYSASHVVSDPMVGEDEPIFVVRNSQNQVVFAVYEGGVRAYVDDTGKQTRGGFAIGGLSDQNKENETEYMRVTPDSARIYLRTTPDKQTRGGFAIGGLSDQNKESSSFIYLTPENYFIGHNSGNAITTGLYNSTLGYESGMNITSGESNSLIGYQCGYNNQGGSGNLFLGYQTGFENTDGNYNSFLGYKAGYSNTDGVNNSFLGSFAGQSNNQGSYNTFVGDSTGYNNISGNSNTFIGTKVGFNNTFGWANLFIGNHAGFSNEGGFENVFIGNYSGYSNVASGMNVAIGVRSGFFSENGWNNVYIGTETGYNNIDGEGNVFIGFQTGMNNLSGTRNIFLGNRAGMNQQGSDKLIIDNTADDSTSTFIWGDLQKDLLRFNNYVGIRSYPGRHTLSVFDPHRSSSIGLISTGDDFNYSQLILEADIGTDTLNYILTHDIDNRFRLIYYNGTDWFPRLGVDALGKLMVGGPWVDATEMLDVDGNARFRFVGSLGPTYDLSLTSNGTLTTSTSDSRLKYDFIPLENALEKILKMKGFTFKWKNNDSENRDVGLIAQDILNVFPEAVFINPKDGYYGINYSRFPALFIEAFKEQQVLINNLNKRVIELEQKNQELLSLKAEIEAIKALIGK